MPPAAAPRDEDVVPPDTCPKAYSDQMGAHISCPSASLLAQYKVPWYIITKLVTQEYHSTKELAERWLSKAEARTNSPKDLEFRHTEGPKYPEPKVHLYALRVSHAVEEAIGKKTTTLAQTLEDKAPEKRAIQDKDRETLLRQVQAQHKISDKDMPGRSEQGSDKYLAMQYLEVSKGHVGDFHITKISPWKTDHTKQQKTVNKKTTEVDASGYSKTTEEEYTPQPNTLEQWKLTMSIFRWTLLMALSAFPEHSTIQITKKQLDDYYEWLYGPSIAQRQNNPPTVYKLRWAERQAWSAITDILWEERHKGTTLAQAITTIQGRTLWWNDLLADKPKTDNSKPQKLDRS